ncbi:MAG: sulfotransferase domain-containing protein [Proteobacteria bacterium]|nr:sulfotransferase domain-containing protein [Pseudomonadota bacterium]
MGEYEKFINELELPPTQSDEPSVYAFSLHKSGSTLLYNMLAELAPYVGQPYFSIQDQFFSNGIPINQEIAGMERLFNPKGYLYGGFRFFPKHYKIPDLNRHKKILLIRNPLDVMVSMYFSRKSSHIIPDKGKLKTRWLKMRKEALELSIDEFVRKKNQIYLNKLLSYKNMLNQENLLIFRYEDIIYSKKDFLLDILNFYGWDVDSDIVANIADKYDVFPEEEDKTGHIRQVHPNNYKKHLSKETQQFLEEKFEQILLAFGYKINAQNIYNNLKNY